MKRYRKRVRRKERKATKEMERKKAKRKKRQSMGKKMQRIRRWEKGMVDILRINFLSEK